MEFGEWVYARGSCQLLLWRADICKLKSWENVFSTWPAAHTMEAVDDTLCTCLQSKPKTGGVALDADYTNNAVPCHAMGIQGERRHARLMTHDALRGFTCTW